MLKSKWVKELKSNMQITKCELFLFKIPFSYFLSSISRFFVFFFFNQVTSASEPLPPIPCMLKYWLQKLGSARAFLWQHLYSLASSPETVFFKRTCIFCTQPSVNWFVWHGRHSPKVCQQCGRRTYLMVVFYFLIWFQNFKNIIFFLRQSLFLVWCKSS